MTVWFLWYKCYRKNEVLISYKWFICHSSHRNRTTRGAAGSAPVLHVCQDLEPDTCSADPCSLRRETTEEKGRISPESAVIYRDMEGTLQLHTDNTNTQLLGCYLWTACCWFWSHCGWRHGCQMVCFYPPNRTAAYPTARLWWGGPRNS